MDGNHDDKSQDVYYCVPIAFDDSCNVLGLALIKENGENGQAAKEKNQVYRRAGLLQMSSAAWSDFRGRREPEEGRPGADGDMVFDNHPGDYRKQDFDKEDLQWIEKHSSDFVII